MYLPAVSVFSFSLFGRPVRRGLSGPFQWLAGPEPAGGLPIQSVPHWSQATGLSPERDLSPAVLPRTFPSIASANEAPNLIVHTISPL